MIQRIQTVYLFIVCVLSLVCLFCGIGTYSAGGNTIAEFSNFTFNTYGDYKTYQSAGPWALGILLIVVAFLSIISIMLFNRRLRQLRLTIISSILLVGYILVYAFFAYVYNEKLNLFAPCEDMLFRPAMTICMPLVSIILNFMAIHRIRKDEALVRSLDRIR